MFVICTAFFFVVAYFYFPETRQKTLEEVAAAFGDKVVLVNENEVEQQKMQRKADDEHIERASSDFKSTV